LPVKWPPSFTSLLFRFIISCAKFLSSITYFSLASLSSKYSSFILYISLRIRSTSYFTRPISSCASSSYFFIFFICAVFYLRASLYLINWS
jgi:hypothetical protein